MHYADRSVLLFLALIAIYSPIASLSSYFPIVSSLSSSEQRRLALGVFINVIVIALVALWIGRPVLGVLGVSTSALVVTGGLALLFVGVPLMRGTNKPEPGGEVAVEQQTGSWRRVAFVPTTFPLTIGGTTFAILVSFGSLATDHYELGALTLATLAYAAVTALTILASGTVHRRASDRTRLLLERISGILLTAIAVSLLANGVPRMVVDTLDSIDRGEDIGQGVTSADDD
jgi:multiple antibiotic resistance protein